MQEQYEMGQIYAKMTGARNPVGSFLQRNSMPHFEVDSGELDKNNVTEHYRRTRKRQSLDAEQAMVQQTLKQLGQGAIRNERFHRPCQSLLLQQVHVKGHKKTGKKIQLQKSWAHQHQDNKKDSADRLNPERFNSFDEIIDTYEQSLEQEIRKAKREEMRKHSALPELKAKEVKQIKESIIIQPKAHKLKELPNTQHKIRSSHLIAKRHTQDPEIIAARSRKQRIYLQKKNNQEKKIQQELIKYHQQTKKYCESIAKKYSLVPALTQKKYLKKKTKKQKTNTQISDNFEQTIDDESMRFTQLLDDVVRLNLALKNKQEELQLLERVIDVNPFNEFLVRKQQGQIQEMESESLFELREDQEEQLSDTGQQGKRWQVSSHHTRQNNPAFNFIIQPHRLHSEQQTSSNYRSRFQSQPQANHLHVNERLKSLLF